jgi:hypothetical protein
MFYLEPDAMKKACLPNKFSDGCGWLKYRPREPNCRIAAIYLAAILMNASIISIPALSLDFTF